MGLKVFGEGEWKMRKYGRSKRRTWRKLHLAINPQTQEIVAETLTENSCDDAGQAKPLLDQVPGRTDKFYGDGAYDKWKVYVDLEKRRTQAIIPPQATRRSSSTVTRRAARCPGTWRFARSAAVAGDNGRRVSVTIVAASRKPACIG
jgi:hypothetical protein